MVRIDRRHAGASLANCTSTGSPEKTGKACPRPGVGSGMSASGGEFPSAFTSILRPYRTALIASVPRLHIASSVLSRGTKASDRWV